MPNSVIASDAKQSSVISRVAPDCFVTPYLAMTAMMVATAFVAMTPASAASPSELISQFRAEHGEGKVTSDTTLNAIAHDQAEAMAAKETLDHDVLGAFTKRVARAQAGRAAENIAYGYPDFPQTLKQWINSPSHRHNLLLKDATKIGVASVKSASGKTYWSMEIAGDYEKPIPKSKPGKTKEKSAQVAAAQEKPKPAKKRECHISLLGLCI